MIYRLIILNGDRRGEQITLARDPMTIGRAATCEIRINDPEVALSHAEITHNDEGLFIRDLGSMNRLLVNHHEVHEARPKHGDVVEVGHTRFLVQAYVQAEFQNEVVDEANAEERAHRRNSWLFAGGLILFVVFLFFFIPRCERFVLTPRTPPPAPTPTESAPQPIQQDIKTAITPPPLTNPPPAITSTVTRAITPPVVPTPKPAEPVAVTPPPKAEPAPSQPAPPKPNATSALIAASERELQEAALTLKGNKPAIPYTNAPPPTPAVEPVKKTEPVAPPEKTAVVPDILIPPKTSPPPREVSVAPATNLVQIVGADINKFPETDQFREMRLLTIRLVAMESRKELDPAAVRVEVIFVNKDKSTGQLSPASQQPSAASLGTQGVWPTSEQRSLVASYVVPTTQPPTARTSQYYGFSIGVYYNGTLQDELRQPGDLPAEFSFPATSRAKPKSVP